MGFVLAAGMQIINDPLPASTSLPSLSAEAHVGSLSSLTEEALRVQILGTHVFI